MASELQVAARASNWSKLQIKGCVAQLRNEVSKFRIGSYSYDKYNSTLTKLEQVLSAQVDKDYQELKKLITGKK